MRINLSVMMWSPSPIALMIQIWLKHDLWSAFVSWIWALSTFVGYRANWGFDWRHSWFYFFFLFSLFLVSVRFFWFCLWRLFWLRIDFFSVIFFLFNVSVGVINIYTSILMSYSCGMMYTWFWNLLWNIFLLFKFL